MGADQDFESFLHDWTNERILPTGDLLDPADQQDMAERRATELMQLAKESGFADMKGHHPTSNRCATT